jgi:tape measure domain-containing protein
MTDPKIRYDIEANATGKAEVDALGKSMAALDDALPESARKRADELGQALQRLGREQAAIDAFVRTKGASEQAARALEDAQQAAQKLGRELAETEAPTRRQQVAMDRAKQAVREAKEEIIAQNAQLQAARGALQQAGISSDGLAAAQVRVAKQTEATRGAVADLVQQYQGVDRTVRDSATANQALATSHSATAAAARRSAAEQTQAAGTVRESLGQLGNQLRTIQGLAATALGGSLAGGMIGDLAKTADAWTNLQARIKLVTGEGAAFTGAFEGVQEIALRTNATLQSTGELFTRIAAAGKTLGLSQAEALSLTESINQSIALSGSTAQESDAAIRQVIQGLQSGVLRGEEFNSVMEQSPRLAKALADGLGVTTGELRKMAEAGQLSADVVIRALQGQAATLQKEFDTLPATVGRALQNLSTQWTRYVGEVDQANGISAKAASVLNGLANNLDLVGAGLLALGKAAIAYKVLQLASTFTEKAVAARAAATATAAETAATVAHTAATRANTVAIVARNAAASGGAAAATGSVSALGTAAALAGRSLLGMVAVGVVANIKEVGVWIGETAAKLAGYRDKAADAAVEQDRLEAAARAVGQAAREQAQAAEQASEAALGLSDVSRKLVGDFEETTKKGEDAGKAVNKLAGELQLGNLQGIRDAGAALDTLALRGRISAQQVGEAWGKALKDVDLGVFATEAAAAFDKSEQGARRLKAALQAVDSEALRRVGTSLEELASGFSEASNKTINDVDALVDALDRAGVKGDQAGRLLAKGLDQALAVASTEKAVQAVIDRTEDLRRKNLLVGDSYTDMATKAKAKLDEIKSGINSVAEAAKLLGVKTTAELEKTATQSKEAFDVIASSGQVSLLEVGKAFGRMREAAIAANGGIEPSWLRQRELILLARASAQGLGDAVRSAMGLAKAATDSATDSVSRYRQESSRAAEEEAARAAQRKRDNTLSSNGGTDFSVLGNSATTNAGRSEAIGQAVPPDSSGGWEYTLDPAKVISSGVDARGNRLPGGWTRATGPQGFAGAPARAPTPTPAAPPVASPPPSIPVASPSTDSASLQAVLARIESARPAQSITMNVYASGDPDQVAQAVMRALEQAQRAGG